jgi:hypothetical protein
MSEIACFQELIECRILWHTRSREASEVHRVKERRHSDNGPAWIGYVTPSKTGWTLYFNGRGLMKRNGQRRGESGGNYVDMETGESFWVSGVKKNGEDRHWPDQEKSSSRSRHSRNT